MNVNCGGELATASSTIKLQREREREMMEEGQGQGQGGGGGMFVKVMTDEQMEVLRKQIAVYATICEQLVDLHKSLTSTTNHNDLTGVRLGNVYCDPLITSGAHKISGRQRWTPTPVQLQILERIFDQGNGTPSKQKIKDITTELSQHGQISETNVYNWFQNRRARSKRKQQSNNTESEVETEAESANDKKTKPEDFQPRQVSSSRSEDVHFQSTRKPEPPVLPQEGSSKLGTSFGQMPFYETMLSNPGMDQLIGKMEVPGNYNPYMQQDDYDMAG